MKFRGVRGGQYNTHCDRAWDTNNGIHHQYLRDLPQHIETVVSTRSHNKQLSLRPDENVRSNVRKVRFEAISENKGHAKITVCCINTWSVKNKALSICDYISSNNFDIVAITETWLGQCTDNACIAELVPDQTSHSSYVTLCYFNHCQH